MEKKTMRTTMLALALLLGSSVLARADDAQKAEDLQRKKDDIERRLFGTDREARRQAAKEGMQSTEAVHEDTWIRLLETSFSDVDEAEEAKDLAAQGLWCVGTARSLPWVVKLMKEEPTIKVYSEGEKQWFYKYGWTFHAKNTFSRLIPAATLERLDESIDKLATNERADALAQMLVDLEKSYQATRIPDGPEKMPSWWRPGLAWRLALLGAEGAGGFARAIAREKDHELRGRLCTEMRRIFTQWEDVDGSWRHAENPRRSDPKVREAASTAVRAVLAERPAHEDERAAFDIINDLELTELEVELTVYVQQAAVDRGRDARWAENSKVRDLVDLGVSTLAALGTDTALDAVVALDPPMQPFDILPERLTPRYLSALEREPSWTDRFGGLVPSVNDSAGLVDPVALERLERVLARAKTELADVRLQDGWLTAQPGSPAARPRDEAEARKRKQWWNLSTLELHIKNAKKHQKWEAAHPDMVAQRKANAAQSTAEKQAHALRKAGGGK